MSPRARTGRSRCSLAALLAALVGLGGACGLGAPRAPTLAAWDDPARAPAAPERDEATLWAKAQKDLERYLESEDRFEDPSVEAYLADLLGRLAPRLAAGGPELRVLVIPELEQNAFALPGGTLVVTLPLLVGFENEAQLAFILAHEIVHVTRRHSLLSARYDAMTDSHVERMRLSRRSEAEADRVASELLRGAGYDPRQAIPALHILHAANPRDPESVRAWSSHEDLPYRIAELEASLARLGSAAAERHTERFQRAMDACRLRGAVLDLEARRFGQALSLVNRHIGRLPRSGPAYTLRARIRREMSPSERFSAAILEDLERGVEYAPEDPETLRALGLFLRDTGERERSKALLRRYLAADPEAFDRKIVERYVAEPAR